MSDSQPLVLSVRQPWAWLIIHGGKDIENRTWQTKVRGRVLIHAAKVMTPREIYEAILFVGTFDRPLARRMIVMPAHEWVLGAVLGSVEVTGCVTESASPWFAGPFGFVLRDPKPLPFQPCRGRLGFWRLK